MDNSLTLARHFARLVWLLIRESHAIDEQKVALRAVVYVSKEASVRLGNKEGRLAVNGLVMPQALAGVQELAERLALHSVVEIVIEQGAVPAELLALARLLAVDVASTSDVADFAQKLSQLADRTVHVRLAETSVPSPSRTPEAPTPVAVASAAGGDRARLLFTQLAAAANPMVVGSVLDEIAFLIEQALREGRMGDATDLFTAILEAEEQVEDPDERRAYVSAVRRLTKPTLLRLVAQQYTVAPMRSAQVERILVRCGQDGVDAVVDQYLAAGAVTMRHRYRDLLFRHPLARESLSLMLSDPRWFVVRQAAEFLGEMKNSDAERALADLLRHGDGRVRRAATRALALIDSPFTLDAVARSVTDDDPSVRLEAVLALAGKGTAKSGSVLVKAIDDEQNPELQYAIIGALGRIASPEAVQKLVKAAEAATGLFKSKRNAGLRFAAIQALGDARTPGALAVLQTLANDRERDVRDLAARTLAGATRGTSAA